VESEAADGACDKTCADACGNADKLEPDAVEAADEGEVVLVAVEAAEDPALVLATGVRLIVERSMPDRVGVTATVAAPDVAAVRLPAELLLVDVVAGREPLVEVLAPVVDKTRGGVLSTTVPRSETGAW
jgi:hypothetical protein